MMPSDIRVPDVGRLVRYKTKTGTWQAGRVVLCWWALDAEAVDLDTGRTFFPRLGDPWEYIDAD